MTLRLLIEPGLYVELVAWPFFVGVAGLVGLLLATAALYVRGWGLERRGFDWAFGAFLVAGVAGLAAFVGPIATAGAIRGADPLACPGCGAPVAEVFGLAITATTAGAGVAAALVALAAARLAFGRWPANRAGELVGIGFVGGLGALATSPAIALAAWLAWVGPLPGVTWTAPARVHVGRTILVQPVVEQPRPGWSTPAPVPFAPRAAATYPIALEARRGPLRMVRVVHVEAGLDQGPAAFPLRVGNRWFYQRYTSQQQERILFSGGGWRRSEAPVALVAEIVDVDETGPLRAFRLRATEGAVAKDRLLYAWNGEIYDGDALAFQRLEGPQHEDGTIPCQVSWIDVGDCRCEGAPSGHASMPPGPLSCEQSSGGNVVGEVVRGMVLLFTLGFVDTGGTTTYSGVTLVDFVPGPQ